MKLVLQEINDVEINMSNSPVTEQILSCVPSQQQSQAQHSASSHAALDMESQFQGHSNFVRLTKGGGRK